MTPFAWRRWATLAFVVLLFVPVMVDGDDLPLSRYPMYATPRAPEITFVVAVALDGDRAEVDLDTRTIADTSDPLIAESWLRAALRDGRLDAVCHDIAARIEDDRVVVVEIQRAVYDVSERARGERSVISSTVEAVCPVP